MQVNAHVNSETTSAQFVALSNFFRELSGVPAPSAQLPVDPADLIEPELVVVGAPVEDKPAVTRRRRTKAEIEAEAAEKAALDAAAEAEAKAQEDAISGEASAVAAAIVEEPKVDEFEKVAAVTTAPAAGGKTFTEAETQQLATVVARTKGPQVVKDKIAELGATRIGDLTADQLNELGNFLEAQK